MVNKRFALTAFVWVAIVLLISNCAPPPANDFENSKQFVLVHYYSPQLIYQWKNDANKITKHFPVNIFSVCQYGTFFLTGEVQLGNVFDARFTTNRKAFKDFAQSKKLIQKTKPCESYARFAKAAPRFLDYFGYQAVFYYPDEFHPLFTSINDCWLFVYEPVREAVPNNIYYSQRVDNRRIAVHGGLPMIQAPEQQYCLFYIPQGIYEPYSFLDTFPTSGYQDTSHVHLYEMPKISPQQIARRDSAHHVASPFSNQTILIGRWVPAEKAYKELQNGFSFTAVDSIYTWSDQGFYAIPLDSTIWLSKPLQ